MLELLATSPATLLGTALVLGLCVGSFLNVVIYRLPVMLERQWRAQCAEYTHTGTGGAAPVPEAAFNLIVPRSTCPACRARIRARDNIPLLSWLLLRAKCAGCGAPISARYPLVELLTGVLSAAVGWRFGFDWSTVGALLLTWFLVALTFIDVDHQLLPDNLTLLLLWLGLALSLFIGHANGVPPDLRSSVLGVLIGYLSLWSVYHLFRLATGKEGMGYGDFKLLSALGAWLGWKPLLPVVLIAAVLGAVTGILLIVLRRHDRARPIAFGPFLALAGWLMLMWGPTLIEHYLALFPRS